MLRLENVQKVFETSEVTTTALNDVSLGINEGEFVAIMGPSGCGKSTLLNIVGMLDNPSSGHYIFNGEDITTYPESALVEIRKSKLGFIFQSFNLIDELTVAENIELALLYNQIGKKERRERVENIMERVAIQHRARHFPHQLSGGQQQRVAVGRALVGRPLLVLADEPTGNLDSAHGKEVMNMLQELNEEGTTIMMVTHSPEHAKWATRRVRLLDGRVVEDVGAEEHA